MEGQPMVHIVTKFHKKFTKALETARPDIQTMVIAYDKAFNAQQFESVQILVIEGMLDLSALPPMPRLKWLHHLSAGINKTCNPSKNPGSNPSFTTTRSASVHGTGLAEYVIGQVISYERKFLELSRYQERREWAPITVNDSTRPLTSLTLGLLGVGDIGKEVARAAKSMGMRVVGVVQRERHSGSELDELLRHCDIIEHYKNAADLGNLLSTCDYVCGVLPSTPATRGLLTLEIFRALSQRRPVFMNIGRGDLVSEDVLLQALDNDWLRAAILDVFSVEPLPVDSALWMHPKVIITPHVSYGNPFEKLSDLFADNYDKFCKNEPLKFVVDIKNVHQQKIMV